MKYNFFWKKWDSTKSGKREWIQCHIISNRLTWQTNILSRRVWILDWMKHCLIWNNTVLAERTRWSTQWTFLIDSVQIRVCCKWEYLELLCSLKQDRHVVSYANYPFKVPCSLKKSRNFFLKSNTCVSKKDFIYIPGERRGRSSVEERHFSPSTPHLSKVWTCQGGPGKQIQK